MSQSGPRLATFVIPNYWQDFAKCQKYLPQTLQGIYDQTDTQWQIIIIDDNSPSPEMPDYLNQLQKSRPDQITLVCKKTNDGAGVCRNIGIEMAAQSGSPLILFNDADDVSHPRRLETVRRILDEDPEIDVVYSTFNAIDEENNRIPLSRLAPTILEEIESHQSGPPQGFHAWIEIGTAKGYSNLTSSTAVRTGLAMKYPFPPERVSEDSHTWMRYSAGGNKFHYTPVIPTLYRIPQNVHGSSSWTREGGKRYFLEKKAEVDTQGFIEAIQIAAKRPDLRDFNPDQLLAKFHLRLAETFAKEKENDLALIQMNHALKIAPKEAEQLIKNNNFLKDVYNSGAET
ncbi:MAG TPA: glycosyltransferase family 2 protein [Bacillota bacterium]|nr:glycosyltransferase family 2 protein [Bacillota bacterium]